MARVLLENVTKKYGGVAAVSDLSLEVRDGEFFVLLGPSGCGKSTVLRLIAGLEAVTSGSIYIGARLVNDLPPRERDVAMVFESPGHALYPHLTAYENMAFGLKFREDVPLTQEAQTGPDDEQASDQAGQGGQGGQGGRQGESAREGAIRGRVERVAGRLGLGDYLKRRRDELSAGHRQSVALGRAMVREPAVFLMDDPLSQLDARLRASSRAELRELRQRLGATIIYVTHNQVEAMALGNRVGVMDSGELQQAGTPQALYERPANMFVAGFIGSPAMNMFAGVLESGEERLFFKRSGPGFRVPVPEHYARRLADWAGEQVVMGLRPEDIHDAHFLLDADPATIVQAEAQLREYLGSAVDLHLTAGGQEFVARVDNRTQARPGDSLDVVFDTANMHVFDPATGRTLL